MQEKEFTLLNRGMNRDLSVSKTGESSAYENHNIRISARDNDTLLSVTNERGNREISLGAVISGEMIGWNVLNNHIIIFTHDDEEVDRIYRIDYDGEDFKMVRGKYPSMDTSKYELGIPMSERNLNLDCEHPIESIVYFETEDIQKIYWVDGKNVLRFMNITASLDEVQNWDNTSFDSNRSADINISVDITKDNSGETRANGVIQYMLTYYDKHGHETGYVWISDLLYLSPNGRGGAADGTNNNQFIITFEGLDTNFTNFRVYSIFRSSLNGAVVASLVADMTTSDKPVVVIDDGAHLTAQDESRLLYLGSIPAIARTISHKDQTLFLGDLSSIGKRDYTSLEKLLRDEMFIFEPGQSKFIDGETWRSKYVSFDYSDNDIEQIKDIPYVKNSGNYPYENQLIYSSSEISTFKGGEKYRFALKFKTDDGIETDAFWIGDAINDKYPIVDEANESIKRVIAKCQIPDSVKKFMEDNGLISAQLMIAEASYADRSIKAQGIVNPTMFNTWERYNNRQYSFPSWITRVRGGNIASRHFESVKNSLSSAGEIQCNFWSDGSVKNPFFQYKIDASASISATEYVENFEGFSSYDLTMVIFGIRYTNKILVFDYSCDVTMLFATVYDSNYRNEVKTLEFNSYPLFSEFSYDSSSGHMIYVKESGGEIKYKIELVRRSGFEAKRFLDHGHAREDLFNSVSAWFLSSGYAELMASKVNFEEWCREVKEASDLAAASKQYFFNEMIYHVSGFDDYYSLLKDAVNATLSGSSTPSVLRWNDSGEIGDVGHTGSKIPAKYKKHLMFVDENVLTLNSPEIEYNAVSFDSADYKFRIIGVAKMTSVISDYTADVTQNAVPGECLDIEQFSGSINNGRKNLDGVISWPMWKDYGLRLKPESDGTRPVSNREPSDYEYRKGGIIHYWFYLWNHIGTVNGRLSETDEDLSAELKSKVFANLRFSYNTIYLNRSFDYSDTHLRLVDELNDSDYLVRVNDKDYYYRGLVSFPISTPGSLKYPLIFSESREEDTDQLIDSVVADDETTTAFLYSNLPINIEYRSSRHAVISLHTEADENIYQQDILPCFFDSEKIDYSELQTEDTTGALIPWINFNNIHYNTFDDADNLMSDPEYVCDSDITKVSHATFIAGIEIAFDISNAEYLNCLEKAINYLAKEGSDLYVRLKTDEYRVFIKSTSCSWTFIPQPGDTVIARIVFEGAEIINYIDLDSADDVSLEIRLLVIDGDDVSESGFYDMSLRYGNVTATSYPFINYSVNQPKRTFEANDSRAGSLIDTDKYVFIGEIYDDCGSGKDDTRYGGIALSNIISNRFINAGPAFTLEQINENSNYIYGNTGDTYFQRWDDLRIKPYSNGSKNGVIDISSFLVETHINLDGRTDNQRMTTRLASIDTESYGVINPVYSQRDNFIVRRDLDEDFNQDTYRSTVTWTLPKSDSAEIDEWTHITLANSLKLDADKGPCNAIRRFQNSLIAFQDKAIAEILFNSRTQLSTQDGVPVEIANSGKVDGKRYLSNKYGCTNKWSIVEGHKGLYFIDNTNKAFCGLNGSIENLSAKLGFSNWFRKNNNIEPWNPVDFNNIVSFYDKTHSDIYLVKGDDTEQPCLVYNEMLGSFTSFYDYGSMPMLTNIVDRLVSFRDNKLWLQNEGFYCNFFGEQRDFWVQYRVAPTSLTDKIWTNIEYRADFYTVLDDNGDLVTDIDKDIVNLDEMDYKENETFDILKVWNEYQTTGESKRRPVKKFRTWRYVIPRAQTNSSNHHSLDRIRNPWINVMLKKKYDDDSAANRDLMQLHDITTIYFE